MKRERGFTLIEILFTCALFLLCFAIIVNTFTMTARTCTRQNAKLDMQNTLRSSLDVLCAELRELYIIDSSCITVTGPGPAQGNVISFCKYDNRKRAIIQVEYRLDSAAGTIIRTDYDRGPPLSVLSTAAIGRNISGLSFDYDAAAEKIAISISGKYPTTGEVVKLETAVTPRAGAMLMSVKATGPEQPTGSSSMFGASP